MGEEGVGGGGPGVSEDWVKGVEGREVVLVESSSSEDEA